MRPRDAAAVVQPGAHLAAAQQHHNAIMTPGKPLYWDHYQSKDSTEPHAIGGYNPVENVYAYDPIPAALPDSLHRYILGAQANVWTEYILTPEHVEYMVMPKVALKAHYMNRKANAANSDANMYTVGTEYRYNKELRFYASYAGLDNGSATTLTPWKEGRTATPSAGTSGKTTTGLSVGMRYDF